MKRTLEELHRRGIACHYRTVRAIVSGKQDAGRGDGAGRRFALEPLGAKGARLPAIDSAAMRGMRTMFPTTVRDPLRGPLLKSGENSAKIGGRVLKGKWRGMPVFTLTIEERATCPLSCRHIRSCYGNNMPFAQRFAHGPIFERRLVEEVCAKARLHPAGFVVRVHNLGDFYSVEYVRLWRAMIETVPALRVFGYTARWEDDIGRELRWLVSDHWGRFAVRFSNAPQLGWPATLTVELPAQAPPDTIVCPAQLGQTASCSSCALCWHTDRRIAFVQH